MEKTVKKQKEILSSASLEFVQGLFEMQDVNKWLKFNATSEIQIQRVERFENNIQELLKKLCVPNYQTTNA